MSDDQTGEFRVEHDSMGEVRVPAAAKWQAQTQRAVENFPVSGERVALPVIHALALLKAEAAFVNASLDEVPAVDDDLAAAIRSAADEVAAGRWDDQFPVDVFQTGSGTSTHMNMNEVLATLATERLGRPVHPNDHVNASQSSNDLFPSAVHVAAVVTATGHLVPALEGLERSLAAKAEEFSLVVKAGRTHLMDAVPVTLGQEFGGYAAQVAEAIERIGSTLPRVGRLPLGGTATGSGLNAPPGFAPAVIERLAHRLGVEVTEAPDHFAANAARDSLVELSGQLRALAVALVKIANDLRWAASGPRTGLGELRLPELQPGSSQMPGKVNPVVPEAVTQVAARVIGNDATIAFAGSQGNFEMNVYVPVIAAALLESISVLGNVVGLFAHRCIDGIEADVEACRRHAESSPAIVTALNPHLGYERAAELVKASMANGRTLREQLEADGLLSPEIDAALDVLKMTRGGVL